MSSEDFIHHTIHTGSNRLHVVESGRQHTRTVVFLHGWPQNWTEWQKVMRLAGSEVHTVAIDLPGIGGSSAVGGEKVAMARAIHQALATLRLDPFILVGHDIGAMVAFAYTKTFAKDLQAAVLMDAAIPGVKPWLAVTSNPRIWHFAFHAIPALPETLVAGRERQYFDYFFDALTNKNTAITPTARQQYAAAYGSETSLQAGFDWYRAFDKDAQTNNRHKGTIDTPMLYIRGETEGGNIKEYVSGLHAAGIQHVTAARIAGSMHFTPEENPAQVWHEIAGWLRRQNILAA